MKNNALYHVRESNKTHEEYGTHFVLTDENATVLLLTEKASNPENWCNLRLFKVILMADKVMDCKGKILKSRD